MPCDPRELASLAHRLDFSSAAQLLIQYESHRASILQLIFDKYLSDENALTGAVRHQ